MKENKNKMSTAKNVCPLCGAEIAVFYINMDEAIEMCIKPLCTYPFREKEKLKIITKEEADQRIKERTTHKHQLLQLTANKPQEKNQRSTTCEKRTPVISDKTSDLMTLLNEFEIGLDDILENAPQPDPEDNCNLEDILKEFEGNICD